MTRAPKKQKTDTPEQKTVHILRVSLDPNTYRDIAIGSDQTLSALAEAIVSAYDFDFDHAFGFYDNLDNPYDSTESYELFYDLKMEPSPGAKGVKRTKVRSVFGEGRKMIFLFDYGDDWMFLTECIKIQPLAADIALPGVVGRRGDSPAQYPDPDDEDHAA